MPTTSISSCWNTRRWLALKSRRRKISIKYITPPGGPFPGGNAAESAKLNANNQYQFMLEHATLVSAQVPEAEDLDQIHHPAGRAVSGWQCRRVREAECQQPVSVHVGTRDAG